jgi:hypothetical protein
MYTPAKWTVERYPGFVVSAIGPDDVAAKNTVVVLAMLMLTSSLAIYTLASCSRLSRLSNATKFLASDDVS